MAIQQLPAPKSGIPSGNTAGRPSSPVIGDTYYNGQLEILEIYNGTIWVAASAPPATPTITSVSDGSTTDAYTTTAGKLTVVFTPGSGGGTPNQYNAYTTVGGFSGSSSSSTVTISGLTPSTSYVVYGNAQNNFGTTVNTPNASAVTPTTLPQVATIGTATASSTLNEVTVTWTNGNNGGKALTAITITPFLNGTTAQTSRTAATTSSSSYTFTEGQLTAGASYTFKVKATNANGTCADSNASNSATMPNFISLDVLIVAGGGGNGLDGGGAGGGGAVGRNTSYGVSLSTNYTVTVGAGGAGFVSNIGANGGNSVFGAMTANGGGGGGGNTNNNSLAKGQDGGCGGGSQGNTNQTAQGAQPGGTATTGSGGGATYFGFNGTRSGDNGGTTLTEAGGSGGGAGSLGGNNVGTNVSTLTGGNGGQGYLYSINSTRYGGGGGGGGAAAGSTVGSGQDGGGNGGKSGQVSTAGTANRGGGAGANSGYGSQSNSGGSGIVFLRYVDTRTITVGGGLTASTSSSGGFKLTTITAGSGNVSWT